MTVQLQTGSALLQLNGYGIPGDTISAIAWAVA